MSENRNQRLNVAGPWKAFGSASDHRVEVGFQWVSVSTTLEKFTGQRCVCEPQSQPGCNVQKLKGKHFTLLSQDCSP